MVPMIPTPRDRHTQRILEMENRLTEQANTITVLANRVDVMRHALAFITRNNEVTIANREVARVALRACGGCHRRNEILEQARRENPGLRARSEAGIAGLRRIAGSTESS